jgi:Leucine-rich repeat (LRR) protein
MESLGELELDNNPLGLTPDIGYIRGLKRLSPKFTGLAEAPQGLFSLEKLRFADLTFNRTVDLPDELFDVPDTQPINFIFCDNPLSHESRQRISEYVENSSQDRKVLIQFDDQLNAQSEDDFGSESDEGGVGSSDENDGH